MESDARVASRISRRDPIPSLFYPIVLLLMTFYFAIIALTEELEALQLAANNSARVLNTLGDLLVDRL